MPHLYIELRPPHKIVFDSSKTVPIFSDGTELVGGPPPWPSFPDLLVGDVTNELLGIVHFLDDRYRQLAKLLISATDSSIARLLVKPATVHPEYKNVGSKLD